MPLGFSRFLFWPRLLVTSKAYHQPAIKNLTSMCSNACVTGCQKLQSETAQLLAVRVDALVRLYGKAHQVKSKPADKPRMNNPQSVPTFVSSPNLSEIFSARAKSAYPENPPSSSRPDPTINTIISNTVIPPTYSKSTSRTRFLVRHASTCVRSCSRSSSPLGTALSVTSG